MLQLHLGEGVNKRLDCTECGGRNTLSITKRQGKLYYNCFKASCGFRGIIDVGRSISDIKGRIREGTLQGQKLDFVLPEYFISPTGNERAWKWIEQNKLTDFYFQDKSRCIRFDPRLERVVFNCIRDAGTIDAAGRSINYGVRPKWHRYGWSGLPFIAQSSIRYGFSGRLGVIVEDCVSACAVAPLASGVALLGTHLTKEALADIIGQFDTVYVALDKDARKKGLNLCRVFDNYLDVKFRPLEEDLKYLNIEQIREVLKLC